MCVDSVRDGYRRLHDRKCYHDRAATFSNTAFNMSANVWLRMKSRTLPQPWVGSRSTVRFNWELFGSRRISKRERMERNRDCFERDSSGMSNWNPLMGALLVAGAVVRVVVGDGGGNLGGTLSVSCCSRSTIAPNPPTAAVRRHRGYV